MNIGFRTGAVATLLALAQAAGVVAADTVWIEASRDTTLIEDPTGALSNGSGPFFFAGRVSQGTIRRGALQFDLVGRLPPGSRILSVRLLLHMSQTSGGPARVGVHRISAPWGERASSATGGSGAPAEPGDATWLHTFHDGGFWALPGGDFVASSASVVVDQPGFYGFGPTPEMTRDVRGWLRAPGTNHGWLLRGDETQPGTAKRFDSRENGDGSVRPILIVKFTHSQDDEGDDDDEADGENAEDAWR